jgi:glycosyltransferase involved in cell wall biosynthesis
MRVLVIGPLPPPLGGIATFVDELLRTNFPPDVHVSLLDTRRPTREHDALRWMGTAIRTPGRLLFAIARQNPAVLDVHSSYGMSFWEKGALALIARSLGIPTVFHLHGSRFDAFFENSSMLGKAAIRRILSSCDRVVVLSESWKDFAVRAIPVEARRVTVIANGVTLPDLRARRSLVDVRITLLGVIDERKGILELVNAAGMLQPQGLRARYQVAGPVDAELKQRVCDIASQLLVNDLFEWIGPVSGRRKQDVLDSSDIVVVPSHAEGMPMVLLEAMASGLPVIASSVGAIPEVIDHDRNGLLIPPKDPSALAHALERLILSPELRERLGAAARVEVEKRFTFAHTTRALLDVWRDVARRTNASPLPVDS